MIRIGMDLVGIFDNVKSRTIWEVAGTVVFNGPCFIGHGCKVSVEKEAVLSFGRNFHCSAESSFIASKKVCIGDDCLFSWDILIMDKDFHTVMDMEGHVLNVPKTIQIGNNVWIGCRATILKGVSIADGSIVAAGSTITKSITENNSIEGSNVQRTIKRNIQWHR